MSFTVLHLDAGRVARVSRRVLSADEHSAVLTARQLLDEARRTAEAMALQARDAAARAFEDARREGLEAGRLQAAASAIDAARCASEAVAVLQADLGRLITASLRAVLHELPPDTLVQAALRRAEAALRSEALVTLFVGPALVNAARAAADCWTLGDAQRPAVQIEVDPSLSADASRIETPSAVIDARLETALKAIEQGLSQPGVFDTLSPSVLAQRAAEHAG